MFCWVERFSMYIFYFLQLFFITHQCFETHAFHCLFHTLFCSKNYFLRNNFILFSNLACQSHECKLQMLILDNTEQLQPAIGTFQDAKLPKTDLNFVLNLFGNILLSTNDQTFTRCSVKSIISDHLSTRLERIFYVDVFITKKGVQRKKALCIIILVIPIYNKRTIIRHVYNKGCKEFAEWQTCLGYVISQLNITNLGVVLIKVLGSFFSTPN